MIKKIFILTLILAVSSAAWAQTSFSFGNKENEVAFINQNSHPGIEEPLPLGPLAFRMHGNQLFIADSVGGKIIAADTEKGFVKAIKLAEKASDMLFDDLAVEMGDDGNVKSFLVIDAMTNAVIRFSPEGKELQKIVSEKMMQPYRIEFSRSGQIYVADKVSRAILFFDAAGKLIGEQPWEWSGMAVSPDADVVYRMFYSPESQSSYLVSCGNDGKLTMERELNLGEHYNAELWWVDEEKQEAVITYAVSQSYETTLILARVGFDGEIKGKTDLQAPYAMNRFIERSGNEIWSAQADFSKAPEGKLVIDRIEMP